MRVNIFGVREILGRLDLMTQGNSGRSAMEGVIGGNDRYMVEFSRQWLREGRHDNGQWNAKADW
jgi:hypothetical protein